MAAVLESCGLCTGRARPPQQTSEKRTCVILIRHGQREDFAASSEGRGAEWVAHAKRPWDPHLAETGEEQARAAASRLMLELCSLGLSAPAHVFTSPMACCVDTASIVAREFGVESLLVEEGLMETVCEAWMRRWAVPGADSKWGGPAGASMPNVAATDLRTLQGEPVTEGLRPEALLGMKALLRRAGDYPAPEDGVPVNASHCSVVSMRDKAYKWDNFETGQDAAERVARTIRTRVAEHLGSSMVFLTHGGSTAYSLRSGQFE
eukprot:TRINITY_DN18505_c0_g1_i1.p1 TRINITY_DN18505_c0_g1~~TRINITY_DN18505_c0_g1_i1.p1  ORF type:complete len:278 (+),score=37.22 TRINITY_DN18505_c0_g1_i1:45-836(+)